ncbi:hypothetical protein M427DRAFT_33812 [Gonapodya prolifera JEL478]|uniref:SHSP domain-containing protein n=1 Tax=Gonapodya prolifera (strain JEL478) TaxID=1344416 RepID=A0A139AA67_GONPJ|nr:hypothetical protein M427DRAFT_33812 [Gonapodya prolifera JEL478]|eukprot:KXS13630.1 hypothetical protein M427DRAFT_33812 [Gonapodya prolifera JEL478]
MIATRLLATLLALLVATSPALCALWPDRLSPWSLNPRGRDVSRSSDDAIAFLSHYLSSIDTVRRDALSDFQLQKSDGGYTAYLDVPGFNRGELNVTVDGRSVSVYGEHKCVSKSESGAEKLEGRTGWFDVLTSQKVPCMEREVAAEVTLPVDADPGSIQASLLNGVLVISAKRAHAPSVRNIPIIERAIGAATGAVETVQEGAEDMYQRAMGGVENVLEFGKRGVEDTVEGIRGAAGRAMGAGAEATESVKSTVSGAGSAFEHATNTVKGAATQAAGSVKDSAKNAAEYARSAASDASAQATEYGRAATEHAKTATSLAGTAGADATAAAKHAGKAASEGGTGIYEKIKEKVMGTADKVEL